MDTTALFDHLRKFDTPTIATPSRWCAAALHHRLHAPAADRRIPEAAADRRLRAHRDDPLLGALRPRPRASRSCSATTSTWRRPTQPTISVVQDIDSQPGLGAFWGEVNTNVHWGLGCVGAVTNGSMRDLDMMCPQFQCLAAMVSPSHGFVQVVDFGKPVDVLGMAVSTATSCTPIITARSSFRARRWRNCRPPSTSWPGAKR